MTRKRTVAWAKDEPFGVEFAEIDIGADRLAGRGVAIGSAPWERACSSPEISGWAEEMPALVAASPESLRLTPIGGKGLRAAES